MKKLTNRRQLHTETATTLKAKVKKKLSRLLSSSLRLESGKQVPLVIDRALFVSLQLVIATVDLSVKICFKGRVESHLDYEQPICPVFMIFIHLFIIIFLVMHT